MVNLPVAAMDILPYRISTLSPRMNYWLATANHKKIEG